MKALKNHSNWIYWLKQSYVSIVLILIYIPLIFLVILSFAGHSEKGNIANNFLEMSGDNYIDIVNNNSFWNSLLNSTLIALVVVPISLFISIFTAIGIWTSKQSVSKYFVSCAKTALAIPDIICGISLLLLFSSFIFSIGMNFGYLTIILSHISFAVPYGIVSIYPNLNKIKKNLMWASYDLGYSKLATYMKVILPSIKFSILSASILLTIMSFDDFVITTLVRGNVDTIGTAIYNSRKGIKAWIVTFGAIIVLIIIFSTIVISIRSIKKEKNEKNKNK